MLLSFEQRAFAVGMTLVSSLAAGLGRRSPHSIQLNARVTGGVIVVNLGNLEHDSQRMMGMLNFSLGVMLYISFADILADTKGSIGNSYANIAVRSPRAVAH